MHLAKFKKTGSLFLKRIFALKIFFFFFCHGFLDWNSTSDLEHAGRFYLILCLKKQVRWRVTNAPGALAVSQFVCHSFGLTVHLFVSPSVGLVVYLPA